MLERTRFAFPKCARPALLAALMGLTMAAFDPSPPDAMARPRARAEPQFDFFDIFRPPPQQRTRKRRSRPKEKAQPAKRQQSGTPGKKQPAAGRKGGKLPAARPARPVAAPKVPTPSVAPTPAQAVSPAPAATTAPEGATAVPAAVPQAKVVRSQTLRRGRQPSARPEGRAALPRQIPFPPVRPGTRATQQQPPARAPVATAPPTQTPPKEAAMPAGPIPASACLARLKPDRAIVRAEPQVDGPGGCGMSDVVELSAIVAADGEKVALTPPAMLRCDLAERVVDWVRDDVDGMLRRRGERATSLQVMGSYDCRGRNRVAGAKLSQHGLGNAIDIGTLKLADRTSLDPVDAAADKEVRLLLRASACNRFTTVLGPGSDGYHENHIHLDFTERRGGYRICHWDVK